ncbi:related to negative acting factor [Phialocephala subalpina]|uniref:Related to negative acting factor n=1 Tax=Phialocephala subalpina TaxID=576137 RepID=A0A1L7WSV9_9HELO|nr:related to negative acting factor [Phialocephala subalpina]
MVYCGKPSKACGECRLRRTKCDYKRPSCSQCLRAGRACKGYRDPSDLMFRDESEGLSVRRQRIKNTSQKLADPSTGKSKAIVPADSGTLTPPFAIPFLAVNPCFSPEEQATCFFFQNYVLGDDSFATGSFEFLPNVYLTGEIGIALSDSLAALGLVGLAHFYKASSLELTAKFKYHSAMRTLSAQLRNLESAKSDQTFIAIMLLAYYEVNTCDSRQSMETWTKHINGAVTLMQLRGFDSLRTPVGYHLFKQLRTQVIINCSHRHATIPPFIVEWSNQLDFETIEQAAGTSLSLLVIRYTNLRASMNCWKDYSDTEGVISTAYALECDFATWAKTCPVQYIYQTINLEKRVDEVFSDHYHVYSNVWVATTWNHYRCARLLTNEIILDQLGYLYETDPTSSLLTSHPCFHESTMLEANTNLMHLCEDICASVPYFLGKPPYHGQTTLLSLSGSPQCPSARFDSEGGIRQLPKAMYANLLIWPLYTAGATWMVSDLMISWVAGRLQWISDVMGIRQASAQADFLRRRKHLLSWEPALDREDSGEVSSPEMELAIRAMSTEDDEF